MPKLMLHMADHMIRHYETTCKTGLQLLAAIAWQDELFLYERKSVAIRAALADGRVRPGEFLPFFSWGWNVDKVGIYSWLLCTFYFFSEKFETENYASRPVLACNVWRAHVIQFVKSGTVTKRVTKEREVHVFKKKKSWNWIFNFKQLNYRTFAMCKTQTNFWRCPQRLRFHIINVLLFIGLYWDFSKVQPRRNWDVSWITENGENS